MPIAIPMLVDRWLGAVAIHSQDRLLPELQASVIALCTMHNQLHVAVNHFDDSPSSRLVSSRRPFHVRVWLSWVPGMKALFWKRVLSPERIREFGVVWLFDADVGVHPSVFPLAALVGALQEVNASVAQPTVRGGGKKDVPSHHQHLVHRRAVAASCVVTTASLVEVMTPLLRADAWATFHDQVLSVVPDGQLAASDRGIDQVWCGFFHAVFPDRPACVVVHSEVAMHADTRTMYRFMNATTLQQGKGCGETCQTLRRSFPRYFGSIKHDTGLCWRQAYRGLMPTRLVRSVDAAGAFSGIRRSLGEEDWGLEAKWLGGTSLSGRRLREREVQDLIYALKQLCNSHPALRILLHAGAKDEPNHGLLSSSSISGYGAVHGLVDQRIRISNVDGPCALFWRVALAPKRVRQFEIIWIFDPRLVVHPSALPIGVLVAGLLSTSAKAIQPIFSWPRREDEAPRKCTARATERMDARCVLFDARAAELGAEGWQDFHKGVLTRLKVSQLSVAEALLPDIACQSLRAAERRKAYRLLGHRLRPACLSQGSVLASMKESRQSLREPLCGGNISHGKQAVCDAFRKSIGGDTTEHKAEECWISNQHHGLVRSGKRKG